MLSIEYQNYEIQKIKVINKLRHIQLIEQDIQKISTNSQSVAATDWA
jgi:hypothetical protein